MQWDTGQYVQTNSVTIGWDSTNIIRKRKLLHASNANVTNTNDHH